MPYKPKFVINILIFVQKYLERICDNRTATCRKKCKLHRNPSPDDDQSITKNRKSAELVIPFIRYEVRKYIRWFEKYKYFSFFLRE